LSLEQEEQMLLAAAYDAEAEDDSVQPNGSGPNRTARARSTGSQAPVSVAELEDMKLTEEEVHARYSSLGYNRSTSAALYSLDHDQVDFDLLSEVVVWALNGADCTNMPNTRERGPMLPKAKNGRLDGAILVFLQGLKEIQTAHELISAHPAFASSAEARRWVLPLHSSLSSQEQKMVFRRPPKGVTKVVLATNIAETSITIDDVVCVIDSGRMKEARYDAVRKMASLEDCIVSKANARQRAGRAGRVRPGVCIHLFTKHCADRQMPQQLPEIQRVPLEQLCLRIKVLGFPGSVSSVLAKVIEPPSADAVDKALSNLVELDALDRSNGKEELTSLGYHLAALPTDVRIGKLMLFGAMLGCIDPVLTIAAALSYRSPFIAPFDKRKEADESKRKFSREVMEQQARQQGRGQDAEAVKGQQSDHLTLLAAYSQWNALRGMRDKYSFCHQRYLHGKTMDMIAQTKRQFVELLSAARFLPPRLRTRSVEAAGRRQGGDGVAVSVGHAANCNAGNLQLVKAALCAALYPNVVKVMIPPDKLKKKKSASRLRKEDIHFFVRREGDEDDEDDDDEAQLNEDNTTEGQLVAALRRFQAGTETFMYAISPSHCIIVLFVQTSWAMVDVYHCLAQTVHHFACNGSSGNFPCLCQKPKESLLTTRHSAWV
jgi:ATP-dependent RNA helicase DHX57